MQLSEKERGSQQITLLKEICTIISDKCVNPVSKRPVTVGVVERALAELHFNPNITKPAKKQVWLRCLRFAFHNARSNQDAHCPALVWCGRQALEAIKLLEGKYPIERAPMRIKMSLPIARSEEVSPQVAELAECVPLHIAALSLHLPCPFLPLMHSSSPSSRAPGL